MNKPTTSDKATQSGLAPRLSKKATLSQINYKDYPECMFAVISAYLSPDEAIEVRRAAGKVVFRHTDENGSTYRNGLLHSFNDEPAVANSISKMWYKDGKKHRDGDLPAVEESNGTKWWYRNDKVHRDGDFPAVEISNGLKYWCKEGNFHREGDLPAIESDDGILSHWYINGLRHRDNQLPAVIIQGLRSEFWENDVLVRIQQYTEED